MRKPRPSASVRSRDVGRATAAGFAPRREPASSDDIPRVTAAELAEALALVARVRGESR